MPQVRSISIPESESVRGPFSGRITRLSNNKNQGEKDGQDLGGLPTGPKIWLNYDKLLRYLITTELDRIIIAMGIVFQTNLGI